jgi:hypothetical protein
MKRILLNILILGVYVGCPIIAAADPLDGKRVIECGSSEAVFLKLAHEITYSETFACVPWDVGDDWWNYCLQKFKEFGAETIDCVKDSRCLKKGDGCKPYASPVNRMSIAATVTAYLFICTLECTYELPEGTPIKLGCSECQFKKRTRRSDPSPPYERNDEIMICTRDFVNDEVSCRDIEIEGPASGQGQVSMCYRDQYDDALKCQEISSTRLPDQDPNVTYCIRNDAGQTACSSSPDVTAVPTPVPSFEPSVSLTPVPSPT